jgi:hypothetical protein
MDTSRFKSEFRFSESEWGEIAELLSSTGRPKSDTDRQMLEIICGPFAQLRPRLGRNHPTPTRARAAWRKVAVTADRLDREIAGLRAAGAADFTVLDACPTVPTVEAKKAEIELIKWSAWWVQLRELKLAAAWAEAFEGTIAPPRVSNRSDPLRDGFVEQLMRVWEGYGGPISYSESGPLVRFLSLVTGPVLIWAGEEPMTVDAIKESVRRIQARPGRVS